ncbi:hypothetical protein CTEN210_18611 [Chaetoceros tenuissimus]|uniref:Uncharacterized protein n=1 Tax=Chaetoceros tenuissimus TaxID=426638 RepID=A0AAD3HG15_9STRA|nr:hypothetical protein CTEN210_18611 [Chaetoceros tenuissimus]
MGNSPQAINEEEAFDLKEVDVRHGTKIKLVYDPNSERYIEQISSTSSQYTYPSIRANVKQKFNRTISNAFLPEGVTPSYYKFIKWRFIQRFINANVHVFGTQSLLMGLGIQNKNMRNALGLSAALNWVLKDALGKIVRMLWASKMGRKFDPDAKRWRYRSSLLFALGNGLEVMTYVYPSLFLILATMANSLKQMSMLTSSATRNALYNSFRDGSKENIGDITAKGEAQIAVVDLLGIMSGVFLSRSIGTSVRAVFGVWVFLQVLEVSCVYKELRAVVFRMLNFERLWQVTESYLDEVLDSESTQSGKELRRSASDIPLPTPDMIASNERIFLPPKHLARRGISFGSLGRAKLSPEELGKLMNVFDKEKFILIVGQDVKNKSYFAPINWGTTKDKPLKRNKLEKLRLQLKQEAMENCHIVLHADANNKDIVKSTLAIAILRRKLGDTVPSINDLEKMQVCNVDSLKEFITSQRQRRSGDCIDMLQMTKQQTQNLFGTFLKVLSVKGWATPARFMFGRVSMRAEWLKIN